MKPADKYLKIVEWSEEDSCYIGTCPGLIFGGVHGTNETKVYEELCQVVSEAIELYQADGKPSPPPQPTNSIPGGSFFASDQICTKRYQSERRESAKA
jgi:predicted RNase H-like HicB family nuclease